MSRHAMALVLIVICLTALAVRVDRRYGANQSLYYGDSRTGLPRSDSRAFSLHALSIAQGRGFGMYMKGFRSASYVPPGHPFFLGAIYYFFGNKPLLAGWIVAVLGSLVPLFMYLATRAMLGRAVALTAAVLVAVYPPYVNLGFTLMTEPMAVATSIVAIWLWTRVVRKQRVGDALLAGLVFGCSALVRPSALAFGLAFAPWLLAWSPHPGWRRRTAVFVVFLVALYALPAAWNVRASLVHGKPVMFYSSISARHAWTGANPRFAPDFYSRRAQHDTLWSDPYASEADMVMRLERETKEFIAKDPVRYYFGCIWRALLLRESKVDRLHKPEGKEFDFTALVVLATCWLWLLVPFGLWRAMRVRVAFEEPGGKVVEVPGWVWSGAITSAVLLALVGAGVYGASDRYRWPLEIILFPFAALALVSMASLARVSLTGKWRIVVPDRPVTRTARILIGGVVASLAVVTSIYVGGLVCRHIAPAPRVAQAPLIPGSVVSNRLEQAGLMGEFSAQKPRWIRYEDVFEDQVRHDGTVVDTRGRLVVWSGRVVYPEYDEGGKVRRADFEVNPSDNDFGGTRMVLRCDAARFDGPPPREEDIVT
ncbi:MAG: glycosyltransferase family 39 protein, partial [bacterium]